MSTLKRIFRLGLRHQAIVTVLLLAAMLVNLLVMARIDPPDPTQDSLPLAARCQGGGPGCEEQPLIPPPIGGLPRFDMPPAPAFGALLQIEPAAPSAIREAPPQTSERPPTAAIAV